MNQLTTAIGACCQQHRIDEKWLLAPSLRVGHQWLNNVARADYPVVNLRVKTLKSMAIELAAPEMVDRGVRLCSTRAGSFLIDRVVRQLQQENELHYFAQINPNTRLAETVLSSVDTLLLADVSPADLRGARGAIGRKAADLAAIMEGYQRHLRDEGLVDYATVLNMVVERLTHEPDWLASGVMLLVPEDLPRCLLENRLLGCIPKQGRHELPVDHAVETADAEPPQTNRQLLRWLLRVADAPQPLDDETAHLNSAIGEVNEIRSVLRTCVANGIPWDDVELLHTDTNTYVPLVYETLLSVLLDNVNSSDELPVTFSEGISCRYSRPGRALVAWLQWINDEFPQDRLVTMLKEGLIEVARTDEKHSGFARLARLLRGVGIGFGQDRYIPQMIGAIRSLESRLEPALHEEDGCESEVSQWRREAIARDIHDLRVLQKLVARLLETCPDTESTPADTVAKARRFIEHFARSVSKLDRFAAASLVEQLEDMEYWLDRWNKSDVDMRPWLEGLAGATRVLGSGPRPGCLHVDSLLSGGHSGRGHTFIVGLDDSRFPAAGQQDPLLLDHERREVSPHIPTAAGQQEDKLGAFVRLLARLSGTVTLSFSCQDAVEDRAMFPSSVFVSAYRLVSGNQEGDQADLTKWLPASASFAPAQHDRCLDTTEWWMWRLTEPERVNHAEAFVLSRFPGLARGEQATTARLGELFTAFDGLVPQAGKDLDPTVAGGPVMSAHALETIGECPRKYFFQYGLKIAPPDDVSIDPEQWLDARTYGSLMHELLEHFVREVVAEQRVPQFDTDHGRLQQLLQAKVNQYRNQYPPPNDAAFQRQLAQLEQTAKTFLLEDARYCRTTGNVPVFLEASIGLAADGHGTELDRLDPIPVPLPNGKMIRLRGRVDRIDRLGSGAVETYGIWDYKSGSTWSYDRADPFRQGRKVQPFVYMTIVQHCLKRGIASNARVDYFGFFFPGVRACGDRLQWTHEELTAGGSVLQNLCQLVADGVFVATNDAATDCKFCDYRAICDTVTELSASVNRKLKSARNDVLDPFRVLRAIEID